MLTAKKLVFAIPFLILSFLFVWSSQNLLANPYSFLTFDLLSLKQTLLILTFLILANTNLIIFVTLSQDLKIILPVVFIASLIPLIIYPPSQSLILSVTLALSYLLVVLLLNSSLKTYLTFQPTVLLSPRVKNLTTLIILGISLLIFFDLNQNLKSQLNVPDPLIDSIIKFMPIPQTETPIPSNSPSALPQISPEQITLLKQNPQLLKQYGLDPKILDQIDQVQNDNNQISPNPLYRGIIKSQLETLLKPYLAFLPIILTGLFFISLHTISSLLSIFISPVLWLTFLILEKSGFTKYQTEQRLVKKLMV